MGDEAELPPELVVMIVNQAAYTSPHSAAVLMRVSHWTRTIAIRALYSVLYLDVGTFDDPSILQWTDFTSGKVLRRPISITSPSLHGVQALPLHSLGIELRKEFRNDDVLRNTAISHLKYMAGHFAGVRRLADSVQLLLDPSLRGFLPNLDHLKLISPLGPSGPPAYINFVGVLMTLHNQHTLVSGLKPVIPQTISRLELGYFPKEILVLISSPFSMPIHQTFIDAIPALTHLEFTVCMCTMKAAQMIPAVRVFLEHPKLEKFLFVVRIHSSVCAICGPSEISESDLRKVAERLLFRLDDPRMSYLIREGTEMRDWELLSRQDTDIWEFAGEDSNAT